MNLFDPGKTFFQLSLIVCILTGVFNHSFSQKNSSVDSTYSIKEMNPKITKKKVIPFNNEVDQKEYTDVSSLVDERVYYETDLLNATNLTEIRNLHLTNLNGSIPRELYDCVNLKSLTLGGNILFLPEEIGSLHSLTSIRITSLGNIVSLPSSLSHLTNLSEIDFVLPLGINVLPDIFQNLTKLKKLRIAGSHIFFPDSMFEIESLEVLDIDAVHYIQSFERVGNLRNLKRIQLNGGVENIPDSWKGLQKLEDLNITLRIKGEIKDNFHFLSNLINLKVRFFNLTSKTNLVKFPSSIWKLEKLASLEIDNSFFIDNGLVESELRDLKTIKFYKGELGELNASIKNWNHLEDIELLNLNIKKIDNEFSNLKELKNITITGSKLEFFPDLSLLTKLKNLNINRNNLLQLPKGLKNLNELKTINVSANSIKSFDNEVFLCPELQVLNLRQNNIKFLPNIQKNNWKKLESLDLSVNQLEDVAFDFIEVNRLEYIDFSENKLREFPLGLFTAEAVSTLILNENKISYIPKEISTQKNLYFFSVTHNEIEGGIENLENLEDLRVLNLSFNKIEDINLNFEKFKSLMALNLSQNRISDVSRLNFEKSELGKYDFSTGDGINLNGNPINTISGLQIEWFSGRNYANSQEIFEIVSQER